MGSGHLEVHITEEVFQSLDICEYKIIIICISGNQTAGNTCYLLFNRNTCRHQGQCGCTDRCLGGGSVGFEGFGYGTDCIREFILCRQYRNQGLFRQCSMADFTASRSSGGLCFTYGIGREIIVMHISLIYFIFIQAVNSLHFRKRSQGCYSTDLRLSTGEHS